MSPVGSMKEKWMKFEPTFNTGQIIQICTIVVSVTVAYVQLAAADAAHNRENEHIKIAAAAESMRTKEALAEIKATQNEQTRLINDIKESVALLRGRSINTETGIAR